MATLNNISNTTYLSLGLRQDIKSVISSAFNQDITKLSNNIAKLSEAMNSLSSTGFLSAGIINNTSSSLKYWLSGSAADTSKGYFEAIGSNLPTYNPATKDFNDPTNGLSFTQLTYSSPNLNNQTLQFSGQFSVVPTKLKYDWGIPKLATFKIQSITVGDDNAKITLSGNVTIKEVQDKSSQYWQTYDQVSGSMNHIKIDLLKEGSANSYYHLDLDFAMTFKTVQQNTTKTTKITSLTLTEDGGGTLLSSTNSNLYFNDNGDFTDAKGKLIFNDLVTALMSGNDSITGTTGNDALAGWAGTDQLTGGAGADQFVWHALNETGLAKKADVVTDFKPSEGDKINLSDIDANGSTAGRQAFTFVTSLSNTSNYNGIVWFDKGYLNISNDSDNAAEYQIALTGVTQIQASDLIL